MNQRAAGKVSSPNGVIYFLDGVRRDEGELDRSTFIREFNRGDEGKRIRVLIAIEQAGSDGSKLYNIQRIETDPPPQQYFNGTGGGRRLYALGKFDLGTAAEHFNRHQKLVNDLLAQRNYGRASEILGEMEALYREERISLWEVLKEIYLARVSIAERVRDSNAPLLDDQMSAFEALLAADWFKSLKPKERYDLLFPSAQSFSRVPARSANGRYLDDQRTRRAVDVLNLILDEMTAFELTTSLNPNVGTKAGRLMEYFQSPIQFTVWRLKAEVHHRESKWNDCIDAMEGYWRFSGLKDVPNSDVVAPDIRTRVRQVVEWYTECLWQSEDSSKFSAPNDYALTLKPAVEKRWRFIGDIVREHRTLLHDNSATGTRCGTVMEINEALSKSGRP